MTKLLKAFAFLVITALAPNLSSAATPFKVDVDNIDNVTFDIMGKIVDPVPDGDYYLIENNGERNLRIIANNGVLFTLVTEEDTYDNSTDDKLSYVDVLADGRYYVDFSIGFPKDIIIHIGTSSAQDVRTDACTVSIDDPSRAIVSIKGTPVTLQAGDNTVKFDPVTENELTIEPVGKPLYRVSKGNEVFTTDYRYTVPVADGDVVNIQSAFPDVDCRVTFTLTGNGAADFIKAVDVDGRPEFGWNSDDFSVKCGTDLLIYGNLNEFEVLSFTVNGQQAVFTDRTPLFITENTDIAIEVRKYALFSMTINIDNPGNLHVYRGHVGNNDELTLNPGENTIEVTRNTPIISIVPVEGFYIYSLSLNSEIFEPADMQVSPIRIGQLTDNDVLTITTAEIVRDLTAMIYLENSEAADGFFKAKRGDQSLIENLTDGYNQIAFYDRDNSFRFETGGPVNAFVYLNDRAIEPEPGGYTYCPDLADGDVVKLFFGEEPAMHTVTITADNAASQLFTAMRDHIAEIDGLTPFRALHNTHVAIIPTEESDITVVVDGTPLAKTDKGMYEFSTVADHEVTVGDATGSISEISAADSAERIIYDLRGVRVNAGRVNRLPAGIYISAGRKILVK